jgi:hypothetical protein
VYVDNDHRLSGSVHVGTPPRREHT